METTLGRRGRLARTAAGGAVLTLTLAGTVVGTDDWWPFAPFLVFATEADEPNGEIDDTRVEAVTADGRLIVVPAAATGFRRAEVEAQLDRFRADPSLLEALAVAHSRARPDEPAYDEVRVVTRYYQLRDRREVESRDVVEAVWRR